MVSPRQKEKSGSNVLRVHVTILFNYLVQLCPQLESHKLLESLFFLQVVLVSAGIELTLFSVAGTVLCFRFSVRMMLMITR